MFPKNCRKNGSFIKGDCCTLITWVDSIATTPGDGVSGGNRGPIATRLHRRRVCAAAAPQPAAGVAGQAVFCRSTAEQGDCRLPSDSWIGSEIMFTLGLRNGWQGERVDAAIAHGPMDRFAQLTPMCLGASDRYRQTQTANLRRCAHRSTSGRRQNCQRAASGRARGIPDRRDYPCVD